MTSKETKGINGGGDKRSPARDEDSNLASAASIEPFRTKEFIEKHYSLDEVRGRREVLITETLPPLKALLSRLEEHIKSETIALESEEKKHTGDLLTIQKRTQEVEKEMKQLKDALAAKERELQALKDARIAYVQTNSFEERKKQLEQSRQRREIRAAQLKGVTEAVQLLDGVIMQMTSKFGGLSAEYALDEIERKLIEGNGTTKHTAAAAALSALSATTPRSMPSNSVAPQTPVQSRTVPVANGSAMKTPTAAAETTTTTTTTTMPTPERQTLKQLSDFASSSIGAYFTQPLKLNVVIDDITATHTVHTNRDNSRVYVKIEDGRLFKVLRDYFFEQTRGRRRVTTPTRPFWDEVIPELTETYVPSKPMLEACLALGPNVQRKHICGLCNVMMNRDDVCVRGEGITTKYGRIPCMTHPYHIFCAAFLATITKKPSPTASSAAKKTNSPKTESFLCLGMAQDTYASDKASTGQVCRCRPEQYYERMVRTESSSKKKVKTTDNDDDDDDDYGKKKKKKEENDTETESEDDDEEYSDESE